MSKAREIIANAAAECMSTVIRGDMYLLADEILAALVAGTADDIGLLFEDVHGASYHDALTRVDPTQSAANTVAAAMARWRRLMAKG